MHYLYTSRKFINSISFFFLLFLLFVESGSILGMGNPLLDISATVGQDFLDKYDVKMDSAILAEEKHQPIFKELTDKYDPKYIAGGATQNTIRVAQWMMSKSNPKHTAFMGCVGNDDSGKTLEKCATSDGVYVHYMKDSETPTGKCAALIKEGERSLVTNLDAANNFAPAHLETEEAKQLIDLAKIYYCAGFFLTVSIPSLKKVAEHAAANDKIFCLNLSAPFIVDFFGDQMAIAMPYADYLFGNESEAVAYGKKHNLGEDLKEIALAVAALPKKNEKRSRTVVFTQGSSSTIVACNGKITEHEVVPLAKDLLVDTNGAGDAFVGGFLSQLVNGKDVEACVKAGNYAAKYIIQTSGTQFEKACDYSAD